MEYYWNLGALIWIGLALLAFIGLYFFKVTAPFGRHSRTDWGPMVDDSLGWMIMEIPSLACLWGGFLYFYSDTTPSISFLAMGLWSLHYLNRSFVYPLRIKNKNKKMPLIITGSAIFFNLINGSLNGIFLANGWFFQSNGLIIAGLVIFFTGMYINMRSDNILIGLRKPGETGYKIPKGFLFEYVTAPNLFGEIVEWFGFLLVVPGLASLSFWCWTMANLLPRARDHHQWYLKKFQNYPANRKMVFPYVW